MALLIKKFFSHFMKCGISELRSALHDFRTGCTTSFFARLTVEKPKILVVKLKKNKTFNRHS